MLTIKDSVHSHIELDGVGAALLDTPPVQRLRYIRQLGTVQLVYPSANHTRFEHSLGVYHLASRAREHLDPGDRSADRLAAAAILHDIGHAPFSHNLESILERETGGAHDAIEHLLEQPPISTVLESFDLSPRRVSALVHGRGHLGQVLAGELDVDRMDYLVRDAHHTGVPYGTVDPGRLLRELTIVDGTLALEEGNVQSAENLLVARALMNPTVYNHHVARISKAMLNRAVAELLERDVLYDRLEPVLDPWPDAHRRVNPLRRATDHDLLTCLRGDPATAPIVRRLLTRDLYKRAIWAERSTVPDDVVDLDRAEIRSIEKDVAATIGVEPIEVIVDIPRRAEMKEAASRVIVNGEIRRLDEQSPLVRALQASDRSQWRLGVYCPAEHAQAVGEAARRRLGLDLDGDLVQRRGHGLHRDLTEFTE